MFQGIKVKLLKRGKIQKVRLLSLLQDFEDRLEALENANSSGEGSNDSSSDSSESGYTEPVTGLIDVSFTVTYQGNPVEGADVFISTALPESDDNIVGEGTTGSAGGCTIKSVSAGDYYIGAAGNSGGSLVQKTPEQVTISKTNNHFDIELQ